MNIASVRRCLIVSRPTGWHLFVGLLIFALGSEYWDKDPINIGAGLQLPWPRFVLALAAVPLVVPRGQWRWSEFLRIPAPLGPMLLFWCCCGFSILSVAYAPGRSDPLQFLKTFAHLTVYMAFVYVVVRWISVPRLRLLVKAYYALGIAAALLSVIQHVHGTLGLFGWAEALKFQSSESDIGLGLTTGFRASSIFGEPSWAARYYVHFMALSLAFWWHTRKRRYLAALFLVLLAFYAANSLLGYVIAGTFAVGVLISQMWRRNVFSITPRKKLAFGVAAYACFLLWLAGASPRFPDLIDRSIARVPLIMQGAGAVGNRIDGVYAGLAVWKLAPIAGVGLGNIDPYIVDFYRDPEWVLRSRFSSDSVYVQLMAEVGMVGLLAFLWFVVRLLWFRAPRGFHSDVSPETEQIYLWLRFLQLDMLAQAVGMLNSADYLNPHLWTVVAIVLGCKTLLSGAPVDRAVPGAVG
jgi:O-antigen ligase/polysaccharide polymerase Wzy-like membrane protein